jgi:hypothetical protein
MLLWALFRVPLVDATALWNRLAFGGGTGLLDQPSLSTIALIAAGVVGTELVLRSVQNANIWHDRWYTLGLRPVSIAAASLLVLVFTVNGHSTTTFIYFQF